MAKDARPRRPAPRLDELQSAIALSEFIAERRLRKAAEPRQTVVFREFVSGVFRELRDKQGSDSHDPQQRMRRRPRRRCRGSRRGADRRDRSAAVLVAHQRRRRPRRRAVLRRAHLRGRSRPTTSTVVPISPARADGRAVARRSRCSAASHGADLRSRRSPLLPVPVPPAPHQPRLFGKDVALPETEDQLSRAEQGRAADLAARAAIRPTSCRRSRCASCRWCRPTPPTSATRSASDTFGDIEQRGIPREPAHRDRRRAVRPGGADGVLGAGAAVAALSRKPAARRAAADRRRGDPARRPAASWAQCSATATPAAGRPSWPAARWRRSGSSAAFAIGRPVEPDAGEPPADGGEVARTGHLMSRPVAARQAHRGVRRRHAADVARAWPAGATPRRVPAVLESLLDGLQAALAD